MLTNKLASMMFIHFQDCSITVGIGLALRFNNASDYVFLFSACSGLLALFRDWKIRNELELLCSNNIFSNL